MKILHKTFYYALFLSLFWGGLVSCRSTKKIPIDIPEKAEVDAKPQFSQKEQMLIDHVFLDGMKALVIEDYSKALDLFFEVLRLDASHAPANFEIAKIRILQKQWTQAEIYAERACRLDPENVFYFEQLAALFRLNGKYEHSQYCYERLTRMDPRNVENFYELANAYLFRQKPLEAIKVYDEIERQYGITEEISMQKYKLYLELEEKKKATQELQNLAAVLPKEGRFWAIIAELNMADKNYDEALKNYQEILKNDPQNKYIHLSLVDYYRITGDSIRAMQHLCSAFGNKLLDLDTKIALLMPFFGQEDSLSLGYRTSYALLDSLTVAHPDDPKTYSIYGDFLQRDLRFSEAIPMFRKVLDKDASKYAVWEALLSAELSAMDTAALLVDAHKAIERFPEQGFVYYMLGLSYQLREEYALSVQYYEQGLPLCGSNNRLFVQFCADLGDVYHRLKNYEKSDSYFSRSLTIDPNNVYVLNNYAYYLSLRKDKLQEAERYARKACQKEPSNATFLDTFAWVLFQLGRYAEAKDIQEKAVKLEAGESTLLEHYGDILWKLEKHEKALEQWEKAASLEGRTELLLQKIEKKMWIENEF